jgi:hypothetical protein
MRTINRAGQLPEHFVSLPLDVRKAAIILKKQFSAAQIDELVRCLEWRCPDCHPPVEEQREC